ncbi:unnamed protein product [Bursaphelenchus okinawaensis]|uniref:Uncharacterized protein n=1 Tax=Bursaphelenchus okinawaensis TaxID=465554 RepID=A0A811KYK4_9BILA|nr:unnamed protein product [Bursaphelenchus okinawaensis]CAG9113093.1 unnamed protein product [Bursaphelenchus okinawaensis]
MSGAKNLVKNQMENKVLSTNVAKKSPLSKNQKAKNAVLDAKLRRKIYEQRFANIFVYGMQVKIRTKYTKDMRALQFHRAELISTEKRMREMSMEAGWSVPETASVISRMQIKYKTKLDQYEKKFRSKSPTRRTALGPRDQRPKPPMSPLAHQEHVLSVEQPVVAPKVTVARRRLNFTSTPKRPDVVVKPRCVVEPSMKLKRFELVFVCLFGVVALGASYFFSS